MDLKQRMEILDNDILKTEANIRQLQMALQEETEKRMRMIGAKTLLTELINNTQPVDTAAK